MANPGRRPTPLKILEKRGSWRAKLNPLEPRPEPGRPSCPKWISPAAKKAWRHLLPLMEPMGILTKVDRDALTRYVTTWAQWRDMIEFIDKNGVIYPLKKFNAATGEMDIISFKTFPQVKIALALSEQLSRLEQSFGLTPSARSRIQALVNGKSKDENEEHKKSFIRVG